MDRVMKIKTKFKEFLYFMEYFFPNLMDYFYNTYFGVNGFINRTKYTMINNDCFITYDLENMIIKNNYFNQNFNYLNNIHYIDLSFDCKVNKKTMKLLHNDLEKTLLYIKNNNTDFSLKHVTLDNYLSLFGNRPVFIPLSAFTTQPIEIIEEYFKKEAMINKMLLELNPAQGILNRIRGL